MNVKFASSNAANNVSYLEFDFFDLPKFGDLNHREFMSKTTHNRKHSAECRFCKAVLTETAGKTLNFHHLEIRVKYFNGLRLVLVLVSVF